MALYVQFRKDNRVVSPCQVDTSMRHDLGYPPSDEWLFGWYHIIGLRLAAGHTWDQIMSDFEDTDFVGLKLLAVCEYIKTNYTIENWRQ